MGNTYGCDKCNVRKDWDNEITWITSSYGLCDRCYDNTPEEERKTLEKSTNNLKGECKMNREEFAKTVFENESMLFATEFLGLEFEEAEELSYKDLKERINNRVKTMTDEEINKFKEDYFSKY